MEESTWMTTLQKIRAQGEAYLFEPLPETVILPERFPSMISKAQLAAFLNCPVKASQPKTELLQRLSLLLASDQVARAQFFEVFAQELAVEPGELETLLNCTPTERKRWLKDGKLPILGYRSFHKVRRDLSYPMHDRRIILSLRQT